MRSNNLKILKKNFKRGVFSTQEALDLGVSVRGLTYLVEEGYLTRIRRGIYEISEEFQDIYQGKDLIYYDLAKYAASLDPKVFISHISALEYWGLTNEFPRGFHISFPNNFSLPKDDQIIGYRPRDIKSGVIKRKVAHFDIRISSKERSVIEAFNRFDKDTYMETLRLYSERKDFNLEKLMRIAKKLDCRKLMDYMKDLYEYKTTETPRITKWQIEQIIQKELL